MFASCSPSKNMLPTPWQSLEKKRCKNRQQIDDQTRMALDRTQTVTCWAKILDQLKQVSPTKMSVWNTAMLGVRYIQLPAQKKNKNLIRKLPKSTKQMRRRDSQTDASYPFNAYLYRAYYSPRVWFIAHSGPVQTGLNASPAGSANRPIHSATNWLAGRPICTGMKTQTNSGGLG